MSSPAGTVPRQRAAAARTATPTRPPAGLGAGVMNTRVPGVDPQALRDAHPRGSSSGLKVTPVAAFALLLSVRLLSARVNLVPDCDEVFNFWEPLHFLLHGVGKQTWEYSPQFALRSYLYLLVHWAVGAPAAALLGEGPGKAATFFVVRGALGACSAACEAYLYAAVRERVGARAAVVMLALLAVSTGMFCAATTFLPSSFAMYAMTAAGAATLYGHHHLVVAVCALGALLAWPFAALAVLPLCVMVLYKIPGRGFVLAVVWGLMVLLPQILTDGYFYGKPALGVWNILMYNVFGGSSDLYGTESKTFYVKNILLNFNGMLPLAFALPLMRLISQRSKQWPAALYVVWFPLPLWVGVMSLQAHKEERFMYVIYPLIHYHARTMIQLAVCVMAVLSVSRTCALLTYYGAPMVVYRALPPNPAAASTVCVGDEWYRFPSAFFLPGSNYKLGFLETEFRGMLPADFDAGKGGTAWGNPALNDRNQAAPETYVPPSACSYVVEQWQGEGPKVGSKVASTSPGVAGKWNVLAAMPFLNADTSPGLTRILFIPKLSQKRNTYNTYVLLGK